MRLLSDISFVDRLGYQLEGFKRLNTNLWNFRCPICGDSQKSKTKRRGHIYPNVERTRLMFKCHNCGESMSFSKLLERLDKKLFQEYIFSSIGKSKSILDKLEGSLEVDDAPVVEAAIKSSAVPISSVVNLPSDHPVIQYIKAREIPADKWRRIAYTEKFHLLARSLDPLYMPDLVDWQLNRSKPALLFPMYEIGRAHV